MNDEIFHLTDEMKTKLKKHLEKSELNLNQWVISNYVYDFNVKTTKDKKVISGTVSPACFRAVILTNKITAEVKFFNLNYIEELEEILPKDKNSPEDF